MSSSTLKIHDLLEVSLHGARVRQYSSQEPQRTITTSIWTQESRTSMEPNPEKPYQPRGPYQSRRHKRDNAPFHEPYAMNSNTIGTEPAKKRHCVSMACMPCRTRRTKCDGEKPTCSACKTVHKTESTCHYAPEEDFRRKGALRKVIAEQEKDRRVYDSIIRKIRNGSETEKKEFVRLVSDGEDPENNPKRLDHIVQMMDSGSSGSPQEASVASPPSLEEKIAILPERTWQAKNNQSRYYGRTLNRLLRSDDDVRFVPTPTDQVPEWTTVTSDQNFIQHLLNLYFTWSHPFYLLFSEEVFYHGLRSNKLKYCTPLLMNTILAIGCCYSDRPEARKDPYDPDSVGDHFFAEAEQLLTEVKNQRSLTGVQALGLMSLREMMLNHEDNGQKYVAQMMDMAIRLGLHILQDGNSHLGFSEIEVRRITFWGCFALETTLAICTRGFPISPKTEIRLKKPKLDHYLEKTLWRPYGTLQYDTGSLDMVQPSMKYNVLIQFSLLSEIVEDILHIPYMHIARTNCQLANQSYEKLQKWFLNLPLELRIHTQGSPLPQIITLHCYYHHCVIQLLHPFLNEPLFKDLKPAREICIESAAGISELTMLYSRTYGLDKTSLVNTYCLESAAIIHIIQLCSSGALANTQRTEIYLADAIRGLHGMKRVCKVAGQSVHDLCNLLQKSCKDIPASVQLAMKETAYINDSNEDVSFGDFNWDDMFSGMENVG